MHDALKPPSLSASLCWRGENSVMINSRFFMIPAQFYFVHSAFRVFGLASYFRNADPWAFAWNSSCSLGRFPPSKGPCFSTNWPRLTLFYSTLNVSLYHCISTTSVLRPAAAAPPGSLGNQAFTASKDNGCGFQLSLIRSRLYFLFEKFVMLTTPSSLEGRYSDVIVIPVSYYLLVTSFSAHFQHNWFPLWN